LSKQSDNIKGIIKKVKEQIRKVIDWMIGKVKDFVKKVGEVLVRGDEAGTHSTSNGLGGKISFQIGQETHYLWVEMVGGTPQIYMSSQKQDINQAIEVIEEKIEKARITDDVKRQLSIRLGLIKGLANRVEITCTKLIKKGRISHKDRELLQINLQQITVHLRQIAQMLAQSGEGYGLQKTQNVAIVSYNLEQQEGRHPKVYSGTLVVVSGEKKGPIPEHRFFITREIGGYSRAYDSEVKALEYIAHLVTKSFGVKKNVTGVVGIYSTFPICASCLGVVTQFQSKFPNVTVNVQGGREKHDF
jgi:hypothetical protein